jgi:hypothetical protein
MVPDWREVPKCVPVAGPALCALAVVAVIPAERRQRRRGRTNSGVSEAERLPFVMVSMKESTLMPGRDGSILKPALLAGFVSLLFAPLVAAQDARG